MDLEKVFKLLNQEFSKSKIDYALIGGLALSFAGYQRMTYDIDFMVLLKDQNELDRIMVGFGYQRLYRSENVANYSHSLKALGQVDFLFARRTYSLLMLQRAHVKDVFGHSMKVIRPEDLIGLNVQSSSNDSTRFAQDWADIEEIFKVCSGKLDLNLIKEYFQVFNREDDFDRIVKKYHVVE